MKKVLITFYNYVLRFLTRLKKYGIIYIENKKYNQYINIKQEKIVMAKVPFKLDYSLTSMEERIEFCRKLLEGAY